MAFDPKEPRDPLTGKWIKVAKALKSYQFSQPGAHEKVVGALGELPKGGHGNLITLNKVTIRRQQTGHVTIKIGDESRLYTNHEDAAAAVIAKKHNAGGVLKAGAAKKAAAPVSAPGGYGTKVNANSVTAGDGVIYKGKIHKVTASGSVGGMTSLHLQDSNGNKVIASVDPGHKITKVPNSTMVDFGKSAAPTLPGSQLTPSQKKMTKAQLTDPSVHGSVAWEYEKGLITAGEYHRMTGHTPEEHGMGVETSASANKPGSTVTVTQLKDGDVIWYNGEKWQVQGELYHTTSGNSYFDLKPVESNLPSKSMSVDSSTKYKIALPSTESPEAKYAAGNMTAGEYYAQTGKYPSDALKKKAQSVPGSPAAKAVAKPKAKAPTTPYSMVAAEKIKKGDVVKGVNDSIPLKHYRVEKITKGKSGTATTLDLVDTNGTKMSKTMYLTDQVEKSNTPEKFSLSSVSKSTSAYKAAPAKEYDPKEGLPSGIKMWLDAWDSMPQVIPPDTESRNAIKSYTASGYVGMNGGLRKGLLDAHTAGQVSAMDRAFVSVAPLSSQIAVHRGFSNHESILGPVGSHVNGVFIDNGFVSTSVKQETAGSFGSSGVICDIIVPKGTKVLKTGTLSSHQTEKEVILNRGTKFKIVSDKMVTSTQYGYSVQKRRVVLEVLP